MRRPERLPAKKKSGRLSTELLDLFIYSDIDLDGMGRPQPVSVMN